MIDLKLLRDDPDRVRESQRRRGEDPGIVDQLLDADEQRRAAEASFSALRSEQNLLSKQIGHIQGRLKKASDDDRAGVQGELEAAMAGTADLAERVKAAESRRVAADSGGVFMNDSWRRGDIS